ncbi:MAG: hypothetical protein Kow0097_09240 [Candidatus Bipolaricaulota bacterium]|nr:hypothetical protein [Candidatus Bipolaricaulota bacterium]
MSDVVHAVIGAGLRIESLNEHDRLFFRFLPSMTSADGRWYRLPSYEDKIPLLFTIRARKEP